MIREEYNFFYNHQHVIFRKLNSYIGHKRIYYIIISKWKEYSKMIEYYKDSFNALRTIEFLKSKRKIYCVNLIRVIS